MYFFMKWLMVLNPTAWVSEVFDLHFRNLCINKTLVGLGKVLKLNLYIFFKKRETFRQMFYIQIKFWHIIYDIRIWFKINCCITAKHQIHYGCMSCMMPDSTVNEVILLVITRNQNGNNVRKDQIKITCLHKHIRNFMEFLLNTVLWVLSILQCDLFIRWIGI